MIKLGTKAKTLENLYGKLKHAQILSQYIFTVKDWKCGTSEVCWEKCLMELSGVKVFIVRTGASLESS